MKGKKIGDHPVENVKEIQRKIGLRLKAKRKELGYSNADDFSYDKSINRSQYGKYEAGSQNMRVGSLLKIINSLGLTFDDFFKDPLS